MVKLHSLHIFLQTMIFLKKYKNSYQVENQKLYLIEKKKWNLFLLDFTKNEKPNVQFKLDCGSQNIHSAANENME